MLTFLWFELVGFCLFCFINLSFSLSHSPNIQWMPLNTIYAIVHFRFSQRVCICVACTTIYTYQVWMSFSRTVHTYVAISWILWSVWCAINIIKYTKINSQKDKSYCVIGMFRMCSTHLQSTVT